MLPRHLVRPVREHPTRLAGMRSGPVPGTVSLGTVSLGTVSLGTVSLGTVSLGTVSLGTGSRASRPCADPAWVPCTPQGMWTICS
jgi:hypothetical protein